MKNMKTQNLKFRKGSCLFKLVKLAVLTVIILAVALYFSLGFVADYAMKTLTSGTGINAGVSSVSMSITRQRFAVEGFFLTNPPGYIQGNAIAFKEAVVDADISPTDVVAKKLVVLDEIKVVGLDMHMELKTGSGLGALVSLPNSNITDIQKIFQQITGGGKNAETAAQPQAQAQPSAAASETPWRIIVKKMVFADGKVAGAINGKKVDVPLPSFTIENIGTNSGGLTPAEFAAAVTGQLAAVGTKSLLSGAISVGADVGGAGAKAVEDGAKTAGKEAAKAVDSVGKSLKSLFE